MSEGIRIDAARAMACARFCMNMWGMQEPSCTIVGSLRRGALEVGDIDLIAPHPGEGFRRDALHDAIERTSEPPQGVMFNASDRPADWPTVTAVEGLKPGFLACKLIVEGSGLRLPVQVFRYHASGGPGKPGNRGWVEIMRTGPGDFGRYFLHRWKQQRGITGDKPASRDGFLLNANGQAIDVPDELAAFRMVGCNDVVHPTMREMIARKAAAKMGAHT